MLLSIHFSPTSSKTQKKLINRFPEISSGNPFFGLALAHLSQFQGHRNFHSNILLQLFPFTTIKYCAKFWKENRSISEKAATNKWLVGLMIDITLRIQWMLYVAPHYDFEYVISSSLDLHLDSLNGCFLRMLFSSIKETNRLSSKETLNIYTKVT